MNASAASLLHCKSNSAKRKDDSGQSPLPRDPLISDVLGGGLPDAGRTYYTQNVMTSKIYSTVTFMKYDRTTTYYCIATK